MSRSINLGSIDTTNSGAAFVLYYVEQGTLTVIRDILLTIKYSVFLCIPPVSFRLKVRQATF